jgi:hypothetical protein
MKNKVRNTADLLQFIRMLLAERGFLTKDAEGTCEVGRIAFFARLPGLTTTDAVLVYVSKNNRVVIQPLTSRKNLKWLFETLLKRGYDTDQLVWVRPMNKVREAAFDSVLWLK